VLDFVSRKGAEQILKALRRTKAKLWEMSLFSGGTCAASPSPDKSGV
jgi:hypothetical protein